MKVRFAIVGSELLAQVQNGVEILLRAVNAGDMDGVDTATEHLLALTIDCQSIEMSEHEWRVFLSKIRTNNPEFESGYLLPALICTDLFPEIGSSDYVLELPVDGNMKGESMDV